MPTAEQLTQLELWLDIAVKLFSLIGVPVAVVLFFRQKRLERLEREYGTYHALDDKYIEYLQVCLEHPNLDIFDVPLAAAQTTDEPSHEELIAYSMLISILERAYLMYEHHDSKLRRAQWSGWHDYIEDWAARPKFRKAWSVLGEQFATDFTEYVGDIMDAVGRTPSAGAPAPA